MVHALKILPEHFEAIIRDGKRFEIRKNDRDFRVNDLVALNEYMPQVGDGAYTGRYIIAKIRSVFKYPEYLKDGYVVLQFNNTEIETLKPMEGYIRYEKDDRGRLKRKNAIPNC